MSDSGQQMSASETPLKPIEIGLTAAIVAIEDNEPLILTASGEDDGGLAGLPFGPFDAVAHRTFEIGLRAWVEEQTGLRLGYVEQLYTFGDRGRHAQAADTDAHLVSIGYLALTRKAGDKAAPVPGAAFEPWYRYFPWEDWRQARPEIIARDILPELAAWAGRSEEPEAARALARKDRVRLYFGTEGAHWDEERVLDRYELLYEAGLAQEAARDHARARGRPAPEPEPEPASPFGEPMISDHRRILATGLGRLRGKLKYRPVVFELMPQTFTLSRLQRTVEAITGAPLHKQNFRRGVERAGLVEGLGAFDVETGGRPAELFRFRKELLGALPLSGLSLPVLRD